MRALSEGLRHRGEPPTPGVAWMILGIVVVQRGKAQEYFWSCLIYFEAVEERLERWRDSTKKLHKSRFVLRKRDSELRLSFIKTKSKNNSLPLQLPAYAMLDLQHLLETDSGKGGKVPWFFHWLSLNIYVFLITDWSNQVLEKYRRWSLIKVHLYTQPTEGYIKMFLCRDKCTCPLIVKQNKSILG